MRGTQWEIGDCTSGTEQLKIRETKMSKNLGQNVKKFESIHLY